MYRLILGSRLFSILPVAFGHITVWSKLTVPIHSYRKFPKFLDTRKIGCNHSKIRTKRLNHSVMHPNREDRMANSVDPDQTALGAV